MSRYNVVGLHERFLTNFPITSDDLGDMDCFVTTFQGQRSLVFRKITQEIR